jgi:2-C-methyl-D-erythritol 4-phosphate cytidylyltransferase
VTPGPGAGGGGGARAPGWVSCVGWRRPLGYSQRMRVAALILAAGRGERLGFKCPKAFVPLGGVPLIVHALRAFVRVPEIERIYPVLPAEELAGFDEVRELVGGDEKLAAPVAGGAERQASMVAGLSVLPPGIGLVVIHDAARPFVQPEEISRVIAKALETGAAILAAPVRDTVKVVKGDRIEQTPDRGSLYGAQTPQVFRIDWLREAVERAARDQVLVTDDAQLVERMGKSVSIVEGSLENFKVTVPIDLFFGEALLAERRAREGKENLE